MHLSVPVEATIFDGIGVATIEDDDDPPVLSVVGRTEPERTGSSQVLVFTVAVSTPSAKTITVNYATADGTGSDKAVRPGITRRGPGRWPSPMARQRAASA